MAAPSLFAGVQSRFLSSCSAEERAHIFELAQRTAAGLDAWAARFPLIRRVRVRPLALSVAAAAPYSTDAALISTARLSLWVFTLDDIFDEELLPAGELARCVENYRRIALDRVHDRASDQMAIALHEVREDLRRYPLFPALETVWAESLCGTIDGMLRENEWRERYRSGEGAALPSYTDYLATGLYSIGGPPHIWAAVITTDDPSTPGALPHLREMEQISATCIRLANDLRSCEKEDAEENINALVLLTQQGLTRNLTVQQARQRARARVEADIAQGLDCLEHLQRTAQTRSRHPEATIADIARFVCDFYTAHDYHTFDARRPIELGGGRV